MMKTIITNFWRLIRTRVHREAVLSSIIAFIGIFAKFSYILVRNDAGEYAISTMFGYRYLSQFLWALGNEIFSFSIGVLIFMSTKLFIHTPLKNVFKWIGILCIASSLYFMGWIFFDQYFAEETQVIMAILFSILATVLFILFLKHITRLIQSVTELTNYLTAKIRLLTDTIILTAPTHVRDIEVWNEEVVEPVLDKLNE